MNRMAAYPEDDLFTPTLTEEDDADNFERPWSPWSLLLLAFFAGFPAGGALLALNFSRLGLPRKVLPAVFAVIATTLLLAVGRGWLFNQFHGEDQLRLFSLADRAVETAAAGMLAWAQRHRYRVFRGSAGEGGKLLLPGLLAAVLSVAIQLALTSFTASLFQQ
jgi:hypothetical protein